MRVNGGRGVALLVSSTIFNALTADIFLAPDIVASGELTSKSMITVAISAIAKASAFSA